MKTLRLCFSFFWLVPVLLVCVAGGAAALCGFKRLDHGCRKLLTDADGQLEENRKSKIENRK